MKRVIIILGIIVVVVGMLVYSFTKYNREVDYDDSLENISYDVPDKFEKSEYGEYYHYYEDNISCDFEVRDFYIYSYKDGKKYLEDNVSVHLSDEVGLVEEVDLNGNMWYSFSKKNGGYVSYYYAIVKGDKGYYMEYNIRDYLNGDYSEKNNFCMASYGEIISSVKLK